MNYKQPDRTGHFGEFGGRFAPEVLMPALEELEKHYIKAKKDNFFKKEFLKFLQTYNGRPTPLYYAENLTKHFGGAKIYIKREDLNHTGSHKITNALGQALLMKRMGKKRVIAETGAGQHGLAVATIAAKFGYDCDIYMGEIDIARQRPNVFWIEQCGARVIPVTHGQKTLKDAVTEALRDWITNVKTTHYLLGSTVGPHPFPEMVRDFQSIIGKEVKKQLKISPHYIVACVGGGSNSMGIFYEFLNDKKVKLIGVEAGGRGVTGHNHASRFSGNGGKKGIVEGYLSYFLQNKDGQIQHTSSVSAGLDYAGIGPEHAYLKKTNRVRYTYATNKEVLNALKMSVRMEGIVPALESAHAFSEAFKLAKKLPKTKTIVINQSGRGDKDIFLIAEALKDKKWKKFLKNKVK